MIWLVLVGVDRPGALYWFCYQHLWPHLRAGSYADDICSSPPSQGDPP